MLDVFKRLRHRKPAPVPQPRMADSLVALKVLAPEAWQVDVDMAIQRTALRDWGRVWEFLQRASNSTRGTPFGEEAARLLPRAQQLDAANWLAPSPAPAPKPPSYW